MTGNKLTADLLEKIMPWSEELPKNLYKNKNNKKAGGLVYGTFVDKNKVIIFSYEYKAGRDEEHESEYEYLMSDTEYGYYD